MHADYTHNRAIDGAPYLSQLDYFITLLGSKGLLVMLDMHVSVAGVWPDSGQIGGSTGLARLRTGWSVLANRYCDPERYWHVFAADIKNEPHATHWGRPPISVPPGAYLPGERWDTAASLLGSHVHQLCPRWLVVVEGIGQCAGNSAVGCSPAAVNQDTGINAFWGENLQGVPSQPVTISGGDGGRVHGKIVYSPHTYGPSVEAQAYFGDPTFPTNMPAVWDVQFGRLASCVPVLIGEWGGTFTGADGAWQRALVDYLATREIGSFFWALNPNSADTGGLLTSWQMPFKLEEAKLANIARLAGSAVPTTAQRLAPAAAGYAPPSGTDAQVEASCLANLATAQLRTLDSRGRNGPTAGGWPSRASNGVSGDGVGPSIRDGSGGGNPATAASGCECSWAASADSCGVSDGSSCWTVCCESTASSSAVGAVCDCSWSNGGERCLAGGDDGSPCWALCCKQVLADHRSKGSAPFWLWGLGALTVLVAAARLRDRVQLQAKGHTGVSQLDHDSRERGEPATISVTWSLPEPHPRLRQILSMLRVKSRRLLLAVGRWLSSAGEGLLAAGLEAQPDGQAAAEVATARVA